MILAKKKVKAKDLVEKIEKMAIQRIADQGVISLSDLKKIKNRKEPPSLLIIEDDETMRKTLKRLFEGQGYKVMAVCDGTELNELVDGTALDLIILDVGLPWINGFEIAELMKNHQELKNIPLIFVSGHGQAEDVKKGFQLGADDYIKKPFQIEEILNSVKTLLDLHES